jgi:ankyrin repeat protein
MFGAILTLEPLLTSLWRQFQTTLVDWCLGLVILDEATSTIRLVHKTLHEYLTTQHEDGEIFQDGHGEIAHTCLKYMHFNDTEQLDPTRPTLEFETFLVEQRLRKFSLLRYAIWHWCDHAREGIMGANVENLAISLFLDASNFNCISAYLRTLPLLVLSEKLWKYAFSRSINESKDLGTIPEMQAPLALHVAAAFGLQSMFRALIERSRHSVDLNDIIYGKSLLSRATRDGNEEVIRLLLERKDVDVNNQDADGQYALQIATKQHLNSIVELLLGAENIDTNSKDVYGSTALTLAASGDNATAVRLFLQREDIRINSTNNDGKTALIAATEMGHESIVQMLLERRHVDVNVKDNKGWSALSWACIHGYASIAKMLLGAKNIDTNVKDHNDNTILFFALSNPPEADDKYEAIVRSLLARHDLDVNSRCFHGMTVLAWASFNGYDYAVKLLLESKRIDVNAKDNDGRHVLSTACLMARVSVVEILIKADWVEKDTKDNYGFTPLIYASGSTESTASSVVKMLLETHAFDVSWKDTTGMCALLYAAQKGQSQTVKVLLGHAGVDSAVKNSDGMTALCIAASLGHLSVVRRFLRAKCIDVNEKDRAGKTALDWALSNGHDEIVKRLRVAGAVDINEKNGDGNIGQGQPSGSAKVAVPPDDGKERTYTMADIIW